MTLKYKVENQILHAVGCMRPVVELSRNMVFLELEFDAEWDGAAITVLFSNDFVENGKPYKQIWNNKPVSVPPEVLETGMLRIGCVGLLDGGETRITTARMERGVQILRCGGIIGVDPAGETPELWEQLLASMGQLGDLQTKDKSSLVAAINEVLQFGGSGSVDPADIAKAVEDYLSANPIQEQDPTVPAWAKEAEKPSYTAQEVGADPSGTAADLVAAHNAAESAHNDIRLLISGLTQRLNALADSDDTTLDQLSEVVAYIKANRELIASITTDKVSVSDIIDNLTTNVSNKPLSAAQGVALKALIDAISIPEKLPSPNALTFTGAATGSYDGSKPLTVNIPSLAVDDSLTQSGQAADAAKVGEELRSLSEEIDNIPGGSDGKSAYQYAVEGGYTGTEAEFAEKLAQEQLTGTTSELTPAQVYDAVSAGIPVKVQYTDIAYGILSFTAFNVAESLNVIVSQTIVYYNGVYILAELFGNKSETAWGFMTTTLAQKTDIPTDDHINSLIDTKLGVIENGSY